MMLQNPPGVPGRSAAGVESSWQETLRRPVFHLVWAMVVSGAMAGLMVSGLVQPFVTDQLAGDGLDPVKALAVGTAAVGWLAVFNALGRVLWGVASDRVGRKLAFVVMFGLQAVTMFSLGHLQGALLLCVGAALVGFNFGGNFALFPAVTSDLFGAKNFGANYGWMFTAFGIAGVAGILAGNAAKVMTGSYVFAFTLAGVLCVISAGLTLILPKPAKPVPTG